MRIKIPPEIQAAMTELARKFGREGGKTAARNMTAEGRSERAKKAAKAAGEKRTAKRLAAEKRSNKSLK